MKIEDIPNSVIDVVSEIDEIKYVPLNFLSIVIFLRNLIYNGKVCRIMTRLVCAKFN